MVVNKVDVGLIGITLPIDNRNIDNTPIEMVRRFKNLGSWIHDDPY